MKNIVLNETPVRTSKNYGINNIEIKDFVEPDIKEFSNVKITDNENCVSLEKENINLKFGLGEYFLNQSNEQSNVDLKINVDKKLKDQLEVIASERIIEDSYCAEQAKEILNKIEENYNIKITI